MEYSLIPRFFTKATYELSHRILQNDNAGCITRVFMKMWLGKSSFDLSGKKSQAAETFKVEPRTLVIDFFRTQFFQ